MAARVIEIANDVVQVINAGSYTIPDTVFAVRHYIPEYELEDLTALKVYVIPESAPEQINGRAITQRDYVISVGVSKKTNNLTTDFDSLVELVEEINEQFRFKQLPTTGTNWVSSEVDPVFDLNNGTQMNIFASILSLTFREYLKV